MEIIEVSIMHHVGIVLMLLWLLSHFNLCHPFAYFFSLIYLYLVHERYVMRLKRKFQFFERKQSNQRRVLTDSESVRWLNHAVEKIWPICMEQIVSQKILLPIVPWFLEKYKPWTAREAVIQHLYMGRSPPLFTEMRVLHQPAGDDHLVLELGMNFLTADDMSAILAVKLRKRLGFGMWAKLHLTGMHIEGKVLVGVKFLRKWPFLGRVRVCFVEPPYFQMTVKPIFTHGVDVTVLPGIAGWLDKLLSIAFEQTLVEPNMLVVDVEKFASPQQEPWFHVDEKEAVACAKVEVIEATNMKPSDMNGLSDPYVKGHLGPYRFKTQIQKKTLNPKWFEEFMIPICTWESPNLLVIEVRDKDRFVDDTLGDCSVNINELRDGQRHDMWLSLQNIKMGRLHLAITVVEDRPNTLDNPFDGEPIKGDNKRSSSSDETVDKGFSSAVSSEKPAKVADKYEPINIEGQQETGIWVHQPGSEVAQTWKPRKGKDRRLDTHIRNSFGRASAVSSGALSNDSGITGENHDSKNSVNTVRKGLRKITAVFHRSPKREDRSDLEDHSGNLLVDGQSPHANLRSVNSKEIGVNFVVEETLPGPSSNKSFKEVSSGPEGSSPEGQSKCHVKDMAKNMFEKGARGIKHVLSRKELKNRQFDVPVEAEREIFPESDSSDDESLASLGAGKIPVASSPISYTFGNDDRKDTVEHVFQKSESSKRNQMGNINAEAVEKLDHVQVTSKRNQTGNINAEAVEKLDHVQVTSPDRPGKGLVHSPKPKLPEMTTVEEKREQILSNTER